MAKIHNLGFPRIGKDRELKKALEAYWKGTLAEQELTAAGRNLRKENWALQAGLDWVPVNDFSFYDQILDCSMLVGNIPFHYAHGRGTEQDTYFRMARGRSVNEHGDGCCRALEMTKWFDTNYHYMVPEFTQQTRFTARAEQKLLPELLEARKALGTKARPVLIGPVSYLKLGKEKDESKRRDLLPQLLPVYEKILRQLSAEGVEWVQIDEPVLVTDLDSSWAQDFRESYTRLSQCGVRLLLTTYFGELGRNLDLVLSLPVQGIHVDAVRAASEVDTLVKRIGKNQILSLGVINGRNIWKSDLNAILERIEPIAQQLGDRLWIAPSCSLLHVPVTLERENKLDDEVRSWLAFATEKIVELKILGKALEQGRESVAGELRANAEALTARRNSSRVYNKVVRSALQAVHAEMENRQNPYEIRSQKQKERFHLPLFPTTTIGSFPQTAEIRSARAQYRKGMLSEEQYQKQMRAEIAHVVQVQEELDLDVLVHGEAERNDMVEYFGEQLEGFVFSSYGWVQSYGSRCVKPPIIFGDISRPRPFTVEWISYAQSLTERPMKGMLTGPVTILNWSFVRDDQPRSETCRQIALAMRAEVLDLEHAGIGMIQIDEAALREGLPLRRSEWESYLQWAVSCFRLTANGVADHTQIHTHMCYSEFNDIIAAIATMDADVITIETSRSQMELLEAFDDFHYPNEIGPGVYDIHSPNIPTAQTMENLMRLAAEKIPADRLWINPDCGLKTRQWKEVIPALTNMVSAAKRLRTE